ncbi:MAG TPA: Rrf2 family transcriptional regulator [Planctomycetota bacterium]|nr:Rrf2 family transcriptional regulator [Planctomycetota bacterium]
MRLSRASVYAVHGMTYLAGQPAQTFVPLSRIRADVGLPEKHLAKIFQSLVRSGLLKSLRGVNGGFALARPADTITALEIIRYIDGHLPRGDCPVHPNSRDAGHCCSVSRLVVESRQRMADLLGQTSLAELTRRARGDPPTDATGRTRK